MKHQFYFLAFLLLSFTAESQTSSNSKTESVRLSIGRSFNGSGDLEGISFEAAYVVPLSPRFDLAPGFTTTIHYGYDAMVYDGYPDQSLRFVTAGLQLNPVVEYKFITAGPHTFKIIGGGLARFQSTSVPEIYSISSPTPTNPESTYVINKFGKQNTFTVGYIAGLGYMFDIHPNGNRCERNVSK